MAAGKQHTKKGRKTNRSSFLCSCFGISSKVSADHSEKKSISGRQAKGVIPVNDHHIPASSPIISSSKEIHVVEEDHEEKTTPPSANEFVSNNKTRDITSEKSKKREESSPITTSSSVLKRHDTWTNYRKLSHSVSLPLPHQKKQKPAAAAGGDEKGEEGNEAAAVGGEFDSTFGAVIISVTLVVMMIWGKFWAIVCTAAWFYFVPRFRAKLDQSYAIKFKNGETDRVDFDSWEYKKKVVLQGLLDRNQNL